jgi:hypothetical protein
MIPLPLNYMPERFIAVDLIISWNKAEFIGFREKMPYFRK